MDYDNIPDELRERPRWVLWRYEERGDKQTKVPYRVDAPKSRASSTNPETWAKLDDALEVIEADNSISGIGFMLGRDLDDTQCIVGLDFDHCIDSDGVLDEHVAHAVEVLDSYTEVSPSGTGLHTLCFGDEIKALKTAECEIYSAGRFFTVTGNRLGNRETLHYRAKEIAAIHDMFNPKANEDISLVVDNVLDFQGKDNKLITEFIADQSCKELWDKVRVLASQSQYDLAVATKCYIRGFTANQAQRLIYLHRLKHNENPQKAERRDYIQMTLEKASVFTDEPAIEIKPQENPFFDAAIISNEPKRLSWLIKNYFPIESLIWLSGQWSSYKTFIMLDIAYHLSLGLEWQGNRVKQCKGLIAAGEGVGGLRKRLRGLADHHGQEYSAKHLFITKEAVFFNDVGSVAQLKANIQGEGLDLDYLVIDTKAANMIGSDSDPATMNDWINAIRKLQHDLGLTVFVIDHLNKQQGDTIRGVGQQDGAADAAYMLKRPDADCDLVELSVYKDPKDFQTPQTIQFTPKVVTLSEAWNDEDDEPQTTLVLEAVQPINADGFVQSNNGNGGSPTRMGKNMRLALDGLNALIAECEARLAGTSRKPEIEMSHWRDYLRQEGMDGATARKSTSNLLDAGIVIRREGLPFIYVNRDRTI